MGFSEIKNKKWFKIFGNIFVIISILFFVWMFFFDSNSYFFHKELDKDIDKLNTNIDYYKNEIEKDKEFIEKMEDSNELEKFARETYYLKKDNEEIFIIEKQDSLKTKDNE